MVDTEEDEEGGKDRRRPGQTSKEGERVEEVSASKSILGRLHRIEG